jgi:hypothetical protein
MRGAGAARFRRRRLVAHMIYGCGPRAALRCAEEWLNVPANHRFLRFFTVDSDIHRPELLLRKRTERRPLSPFPFSCFDPERPRFSPVPGMRRWFLSYHSPDQALAERLNADAASRIFFAPSHMRAGGSWTTQLAKEIAEATAFILLVGEKGSHSAIARSCVNGPHFLHIYSYVGIDHLPPA